MNAGREAPMMTDKPTRIRINRYFPGFFTILFAPLKQFQVSSCRAASFRGSRKNLMIFPQKPEMRLKPET
jgi:hypothetical protein